MGLTSWVSWTHDSWLRIVEKPTRGAIRFDGTDMAGLEGAELRKMRSRMQMVFQDPYASLDPRMNVAGIVAEPTRARRVVVDSPVAEAG